MDLEVKIKEEPICLEETSNTSCDNYKIIFEEMHLKEEPKSELAVAGETQPTINIKNEVTVDEPPERQLVACFKEEDKFGNVALLTGGPLVTSKSRCKILKDRNFTEIASSATTDYTYWGASTFLYAMPQEVFTEDATADTPDKTCW
ncbi:uncharacterized protein [Anabrus simplex]|uniref:uncharacterized protein n=1 Tax=Anabrus simplex TaxID=316456 RepID=UPI0035A30852